MKLIHTGRKSTYINSRQPKKKFKMLKSKKQIECLENDCTDIFHSNLIDYYCCRPTELENMCVFRFCSWYSKCYDPPSKRERYQNNRIYIAKYDLWMRKSKRPCVVRSLSSYALTILRKEFQDVHTVVIDEISMVSQELLMFLSRRLSEIKTMIVCLEDVI